MSFEDIQVNGGAVALGGTLEVTVTAGLNEAARSFTITVSEPAPPGAQPWQFPPGTPVTITASGSLLLAGYVDTYSPRGDSRSHSVTVSGRGRGCDFADCSAVHATGRFEDKSPLEIAIELDKFGVGIGSDIRLEPITFTQLRQGETCFDFVMRQCQPQRAVMKGEADGRITITRAGTRRHAGALVQGDKIVAMSADLSMRERFSEYAVKGQSALGTTDAELRIEEKAMDARVPRYRPRILIDQGDSSKKRARTRADWEANRAAGFAAKASIAHIGFRDDAGALWEPGWLIYTSIPWLKIEQDMTIEQVAFRQGDGGTVSELSLVDPRAYGGQKPGALSSDAMWGMP